MPPLPNVNDVLRIALIGKYDNDVDVVNRVYISVTGGTPPVSLNTMCSTIAGNWNTDLAAQAGVHFTLTEVDAEDLTSSTSPVGAITTSHIGTRSGGPLTGATCALLRFHIGRRYRGGHPRIYLPYGTDTDLTDVQTWTTAFLSGLTTAWTTFIGHVISAANTAYAVGVAAHINVSYYEGFTNITYPSGRIYPRPTLRTTPLQDDVLSYTANPKIASQRRRNLTP